MSTTMRPSEKARRAIIRSLAFVTELVEIQKDDPNDPLSSGFKAIPSNLFDLAFSRVGVNEDTIEIFRRKLIEELSEIEEVIESMPLAPGVSIGIVWEFISVKLEQKSIETGEEE